MASVFVATGFTPVVEAIKAIFARAEVPNRDHFPTMATPAPPVFKLKLFGRLQGLP